MILTSIEPNIFRMLFSIKNKKIRCCKPPEPLVGPKNPSSPWNIDTPGYYWKHLPKAFSVITSSVSISWRGRVFLAHQRDSRQHHIFLIFDGNQHPKSIWLGGIQVLRHQRGGGVGWPNDDVWWQGGWGGVAKWWRDQKTYIKGKITLFSCAENKVGV